MGAGVRTKPSATADSITQITPRTKIFVEAVAEPAAYWTAMVTVLDCVPAMSMRTGTAAPDGASGGICTLS
jgi:hypothetical protein